MKLTAEQRQVVDLADQIKRNARKADKRARSAKVQPTAPGQRQTRVRDGDYLAWVRQLPCVVCAVLGQPQAARTEAAHLRAGYLEAGLRPTGGGEKPDDRRTTPLCRTHHQVGPNSQHGDLGERRWWQAHGIYPPGLIAFLSNAYDAGQDGEPVIARFVELSRKDTSHAR